MTHGHSYISEILSQFTYLIEINAAVFLMKGVVVQLDNVFSRILKQRLSLQSLTTPKIQILYFICTYLFVQIKQTPQEKKLNSTLTRRSRIIGLIFFHQPPNSIRKLFSLSHDTLQSQPSHCFFSHFFHFFIIPN